MSRNDTCARVVHLVGCASHVSNAMRVTTIRAPWEPAEVNSDPRPETAPRCGLIHRRETRQAERNRLTQTLNAIRAEWADYREALL